MFSVLASGRSYRCVMFEQSGASLWGYERGFFLEATFGWETALTRWPTLIISVLFGGNARQVPSPLGFERRKHDNGSGFDVDGTGKRRQWSKVW
jgi:hypothetical protein